MYDCYKPGMRDLQAVHRELNQWRIGTRENFYYNIEGE